MGDLINYYSRKDVQRAIVDIAKNREIAVKFGDKGYGKRPDILQFENDIEELAKQGATSFNISEEHWKNPLILKAGMTKKQLDEIRLGWDLIIDVDGLHLDYSKLAAYLIIEALKFYDVNNYSIKFSVTGDTNVLIDCNNKISLIPLNEAVKLHKLGKKIKVLSLAENNRLSYKKVIDTLTHKDKIYEIYHEQSGLPIKATRHHSVFCWDKGVILQKKVLDLKERDYLISYLSSKDVKYFKQKIINEFIFLSKNKKILLKITKGLMRLIGYYLAEGHATKTNYMVGFSFNKNEDEYINDCKNLIKNLPNFSCKIRDQYPNPQSHQVIFYSKEWFKFFSTICGTRENKHVPSFVWKIPRVYFLELLLGYVRGDAHKKSLRYLTVKSVSHRLIKELIWLCKLHNISCNIYKEFNKSHKLPQGNWFKGSYVYIIKILRSDIPINEFNVKRGKFTPYPTSRTFPIDGLREVYERIKPGNFLQHRREQMTLKKKRANLERITRVITWFEKYHTLNIDKKSKKIIDNYKSITKSDICVLRVRKIIKKRHKYTVYDLSVKDTERFFGGDYPILLHNSGNRGFHIGIPFEAFSSIINNQEAKILFPDAARILASYLKEMIKEPLTNKILEKETIKEIGNKINKNKDFFVKDNIIDVSKLVDIDNIAISSRHMFRAPYSYHEKSRLISIPIKDSEILNFDKEKAKMENVKVNLKFLDTSNIVSHEASQLMTQAFYWNSRNKKEEIKIEKKEFSVPSYAVKPEYFPPCITHGLNGLEDGRKRFLFILLNFLKNIGYNEEEIKDIVANWNKRNKESLPENYIQSQLNWSKRQKLILPQNCPKDKENLSNNFNNYYVDLHICNPDNLCKKIKNPVQYSTRKSRAYKNK